METMREIMGTQESKDITSDTVPTPPEPESFESEHRLGILFVHGIGEQREGDTLVAFGEPLIEWIREWIAGHGRLHFREPMQQKFRDLLARSGVPSDGVEVVDAELFPSRRQSTDPPHLIAEVRIKNAQRDERQQRQRWLLAECWWGEQVQTPPVFALLGWLFSRGPWVALAHFAERAWRFVNPKRANDDTSLKSRVLRLIDKTRWRHIIWPVNALLFLLASLMLQLLLVVAAVFALIPIPVVRRYVSMVLQVATSILGDSYGLVAIDAQRSAILTRFRDTVEWLRPKCAKTVIVAHSQGAAVVHEAIGDGLIEPPDF